MPILVIFTVPHFADEEISETQNVKLVKDNKILSQVVLYLSQGF